MLDRTRRRGGLLARLVGERARTAVQRLVGERARTAVQPPVQRATAALTPAPAPERVPAPVAAAPPVSSSGAEAWVVDADAVEEPAAEDVPASEEAPTPAEEVPAAAEPVVDWETSRWLPDDVAAPLAEAEPQRVTTPSVAEPQPSPWAPDDLGAGSQALALVRAAALGTDELARAVRAYCNELLDFGAIDEACETIMSRVQASSADGPAPAEEVLRVTRRTVAEYAHAPDAWRGLTPAVRREACRATPARLAARDGHTLNGAARAELEGHLAECMTCQAIELRCKRAERAFAATLALAAVEATQGGGDVAVLGEGAVAASTSRGRSIGDRLGRLPGWTRLAGAAASAALLAAVIVLLTASSASNPSATGGSAGAAQAGASTRPAAATSTAVHRHATAVVHRRARHRTRAHRPVKHSKPGPTGGGAATGAAPSSSGSSAVSSAPASSAAPVAAAPAPAPASSSGSSGAGGSSGSAGGSSANSGSVSATQQGSNLPAQSAPTQGISSGGSTGSQ